MRTRASLLLSGTISIVVAISGCGDGTAPEEEGPPEAYAFVLMGDAGITIGGEVAAYAIDTEDESLLEVWELLGGTFDGQEWVWEGVTMVRAATRGAKSRLPRTRPMATSTGFPRR